MTVKPVDLSQTGGRLPSSQTAPAPPPRPPEPTPMPVPPPPPGTESPKDDHALCRRCGLDPVSDPEKIDGDDLVAFSQSVWRNESFTKRFSFFGGAVVVEFRSLSSDQAEASQRAVLAAAARADQVNGALSVLSIGDRVEEHQMGFSIAKLLIAEKRYEALDSLDSQLVLDTVKKITGNHIAYQTVRTAYREFYVLVQKLIRAGANPSFWEATLPSGLSPASPTTATRV